MASGGLRQTSTTTMVIHLDGLEFRITERMQPVMPQKLK